MRPGGRWFLVVLILLSLLPIGCGSGTAVETNYGRIRGQSINGTGAFAEILRAKNHEVKAATRANEELSDWADVIVRFAPYPGPIDREEAAWLTNWLNAAPDRQLLYVARDFDTEFEFWEATIAAQPPGTDPLTIQALERRRDRSRLWLADLPPKAKHAADGATWFEFSDKPGSPGSCQKLEGSWAEGADAAASKVAKHEVFKVLGGEDVLLSSEDSPLAIGWTFANHSRVAVVANGSFLLNAALLNHARRPLTMHVADWVGSKPRHVAFLEGRMVALNASEAQNEAASSSQFHLLQVAPFNWIAAHLIVFLFLLAFSFAVRLGRPKPEASLGVERPSAHPEALGALLARTGRIDAARFLLENYRRWRQISPLAGRSAPTNPPSPSR